MLAVPSVTIAQVAETSGLYKQIMRADGKLFHDRFNNCKLDELDTLISDNFHFIHDQNGSQSRSEFLKGFKDSICSTPARKPIRKAVPGTIQVFALYNEGRLYGAIETGEHDFYIKEPGKALYKTDAGRFSNVWLLAKTGWKLSESLSYDHHEPRPADKFDAVYPAPLFDNRDKIIALMHQHNIPSMAMAWITDGEVAEVRAFGTYDDHRAIPVNAIYNVASLTHV